MFVGVLAIFGVLALAAATDIKTSKSNAVVKAETSADVTSERQGRVRRTLPTDEEMQLYLDLHNDYRREQGASNMNELVSCYMYIYMYLD